MSHIIRITGLMLLAYAGVLYANPQNQPTIKLAVGDHYPPYVSKSSPHYGCVSELVQQAFKAQKLDSQLYWLRWQDAYIQTVNTQYTATFPWAYSKVREKQMHFSAPLYSVPTYAWVKETPGTSYQSLQDLRGSRICLPAGYGALGELGEMIRDKTLKRVSPDSMQQCFNWLAEGKVTAVSAVELEARQALQNLPKAEQQRIQRSFVIRYDEYHLLISRKHPDGKALIERFNQGLRKVQSDERKPVYYGCGLFAHIDQLF
ncbi:substrate-binding periplasmic protein [Dongshaea marina]|uniref:substrate-binding periplasmic protein n=1 Tax=Dongshaea marina TaxID=2047966 RepID=UPI000D3E5DCA|nr:transporter substrate-binding domain-containing protein [Dongshaea marina]